LHDGFLQKLLQSYDEMYRERPRSQWIVKVCVTDDDAPRLPKSQRLRKSVTRHANLDNPWRSSQDLSTIFLQTKNSAVFAGFFIDFLAASKITSAYLAHGDVCRAGACET